MNQEKEKNMIEFKKGQKMHFLCFWLKDSIRKTFGLNYQNTVDLIEGIFHHRVEIGKSRRPLMTRKFFLPNLCPNPPMLSQFLDENTIGSGAWFHYIHECGEKYCGGF